MLQATTSTSASHSPCLRSLPPPVKTSKTKTQKPLLSPLPSTSPFSPPREPRTPHPAPLSFSFAYLCPCLYGAPRVCELRIVVNPRRPRATGPCCRWPLVLALALRQCPTADAEGFFICMPSGCRSGVCRRFALAVVSTSTAAPQRPRSRGSLLIPTLRDIACQAAQHQRGARGHWLCVGWCGSKQESCQMKGAAVGCWLFGDVVGWWAVWVASDRAPLLHPLI